MIRSRIFRAAAQAAALVAAAGALAASNSGTTVLATFDSDGKPSNLEATRETYSSEFLAAIGASLPEQKRVPTEHPEFLADTTERNLNFVEDCDVWISFVHEGAGYRNSAAVFRYDTASPPEKESEIERLVAFPNASFTGSGGALRAGDTVALGSFKKGESLGFCCIADGFRNGKVTGGNGSLYSINALNPESKTTLREHTVLLKDPDKGRFVIAFEDMRRDGSGCDEDFNDLILSVQVNPPEAVSTTDVVELAGMGDADGDGVIDAVDDYPDDAKRAFRVEYPAAGVNGTLAFEDMWPKQGDYDFNDLVMSWHVTQARDAKGQVVDVTSTFGTLACGATRRFGIHWRLPLESSLVSGATVSVDGGKASSLSADSGVAEATFTLAKSVADAIDFAKGSDFSNTESGTAVQKGRTFTVNVAFTTAQSPTALGAAPYDLFIRDGNAEVHLPGLSATSRMNTSLWNSADDASDLKKGVTYRTKTGLPWAIATSAPWKHPREGMSISEAYPDFATWAESGGTKATDWATRPAKGALWTGK